MIIPKWRVQHFTVIPSLPNNLERLREIGHNLWWYWDHEATALFRRIDQQLWEDSNHNPIALLGLVPQARFNELADDDAYLAHLASVYRRMETYMTDNRWFQRNYPEQREMLVAYFSAEYGLAECLQIYSGGLGILSGDHLKSASDLGLRFVAVGLLYHKGYFRQYLNTDGWQQEHYPTLDLATLPVRPLKGTDGGGVYVEIPVGSHRVTAKIWTVTVGRVTAYLLDTNVESNGPADREITAQLYGGDTEMRIRQEIVLGMGGLILLKTLGIKPTVFHMNEGHSAFLALQRIKMLMQSDGLSFAEAQEACSANNVFTTHTPVPAGNDLFPPERISAYFAPYRKELGLSEGEFLGLGRIYPDDAKEQFSMTVLAIRLSDHYNGVSKLHGKVSRSMWQAIWPNHPADEVPITHITNGIHHPTWVAAELAELFNLYLGPAWRENATSSEAWRRVKQIPDAELWRTHERQRERLVAFCRYRLRAQLMRRGATPADLRVAMEVLDPEALTIGFARRFATYKRGTLIFRDAARLARILNDAQRPVQLIFAGKAHPKDQSGKEFIREIVHFASRPEFRRRVVFVEDYDMNVGRFLTQGVDVWLNNPRRPLEASGTSGMKATLNGVLNASILDGWWDEGYAPGTGWAIGSGEEYTNVDYQDDVESNAIYNLLEKEIVPAFYERGASDLPRRWTGMMKEAILNHGPFFTTDRMVARYTTEFYLAGHERWSHISDANFQGAKQLTAWKQRVAQHWSAVRVGESKATPSGEARVGEALRVTAAVILGELTPDDVTVQLYVGRLTPEGTISAGETIDMSCGEPLSDNEYAYAGEIPCATSGQHGFAVRVIPKNHLMSNSFETYLMSWEQPGR